MSKIGPGMSDLARIWNTRESTLTPHLSQFPTDTTNPFTSRRKQRMHIPAITKYPISHFPQPSPVNTSTQTRENVKCESIEITHSKQASLEDTSHSSSSLPDSFTQLLREAESALNSMNNLRSISVQDLDRTMDNKVGMSYEEDEVEACLRASTGEPPLVTVQPYSRHWKRSGVYQWRKPASVARHEVAVERKVRVKNRRSECYKKPALKITLQTHPRISHNTALLELPSELISLILSYLPLPSLLAISQSCRRLLLLSNSPFLYARLNLSRMTVSAENLDWIISKQPKHFNCIKSSVSLTESQSQVLFQGIAPCLQSIHLYPGTPYTLKGDSVCHFLSQHTTQTLTSVRLNWVGVTDLGLSSLSSLHSLTELSVAGANQITDQAIVPLLLKFQTKLESLDVSSCIQLTNRTGFVVATCHNLASLNLGACYQLTDRAFKLILSSLHSIHYLDLHGNPGLAETDSSVLEGLSECSKLNNLNLSHSVNIQDSHLMHLVGKWPNLEQLSVKNCKLTDAFITAVAQARLPRLTHLDVSGLPVSSFALSALVSSYQLSLTSISLNSCIRITQKSILRLIEKCKKLETVSVFDTKIYPVPSYLLKSKVKLIGATPLLPIPLRNIDK